jgi:hypothetical protein
MLVLGEGWDLGGDIFVVNFAFTAILFDIGQLVDGKCVFLVQGNAVKLFSRGYSLLGGLIFDKGKPGPVSARDFGSCGSNIPFGHALLIHGHVDRLIAVLYLAGRIETLGEELDQLWLLIVVDDW